MCRQGAELYSEEWDHPEKPDSPRHLLSATATHRHICKQCRAWFTPSQKPFAPKINTALLPAKPQVAFCSGFIWNKEKEMWNSKGFELSTCLTISSVGLSLHWSHCRCVNLCHLRLNSMPTEQASMLQIISSTCFRLFLEALHQSPWRTPYLTPSSPDEIPSVFHFCVLPHFSASAPQSCPSENRNIVKNYIHP